MVCDIDVDIVEGFELLVLDRLRAEVIFCLHYERKRVRLDANLSNFLVRSFLISKKNVFFDGFIEKKWFLHHNGQLLTQVRH